MAGIRVGSKFPPNFSFRYIDPAGDPSDASCKIPVTLDLTEQYLENNNVLIVAVPAAFSPTCSDLHIPEILEKLPQFKDKGINLVLVVSNNDAFVLNAWYKQLVDPAKVPASSDFRLLFASDINTEFSRKIGYVQDSSKFGMGLRTSRYAVIIRKGIVTYCQQEIEPGVSVSGAKALLSKL